MMITEQRKVVSQGYSISFNSNSPFNSDRRLELGISSASVDKTLSLIPERNDWESPIKILNFVNALRRSDSSVEFSIFKELVKTYRNDIGIHTLTDVSPHYGKYKNMQISDEEFASLTNVKLHGIPGYTEKGGVANMLFKGYSSEFLPDIQRVRYYTVSLAGAI